VDRHAYAVIVAEAVFGKRSIDLVAQWIVALIHSCICAPRLVNVASQPGILTSLLTKTRFAIFWTTIAIFRHPRFCPGTQFVQKMQSAATWSLIRFIFSKKCEISSKKCELTKWLG
jgi:hypothetical protein